MRTSIVVLLVGIGCCAGGYRLGTVTGLGVLAVGVMITFAAVAWLIPWTDVRPPTLHQLRPWDSGYDVDVDGQP